MYPMYYDHHSFIPFSFSGLPQHTFLPTSCVGEIFCPARQLQITTQRPIINYECLVDSLLLTSSYHLNQPNIFLYSTK